MDEMEILKLEVARLERELRAAKATLRDTFAVKAMESVNWALTNRPRIETAKICYRIADEMMAARSES